MSTERNSGTSKIANAVSVKEIYSGKRLLSTIAIELGFAVACCIAGAIAFWAGLRIGQGVRGLMELIF